jgi:hypothetical protein
MKIECLPPINTVKLRDIKPGECFSFSTDSLMDSSRIFLRTYCVYDEKHNEYCYNPNGQRRIGVVEPETGCILTYTNNLIESDVIPRKFKLVETTED